MDEPIVGIDLGTTNSEVAFVVDGKPQIIMLNDDGIVPSCVGMDAGGQLLVGKEARNQAVLAPERTVRSVKRKMGTDDQIPMGAETYSPQEISAFILKALKGRAEQVLGCQVKKAVITVPAFFTDAQRQATREAGALAGLEVVRIINEPTAAALAYEGRTGESHRVLVYDLGGGTFDVSVVQIESGVVEVLSSTGDTHLGGDDFDQLILERLLAYLKESMGVVVVDGDRVLKARLLRAAEAAKIALSSAPYARIQEDHVGEVNGEVRHLSFELSRQAFEEMIAPLLDRTMEAVSRALTDAMVRPSQIDKILLVGGSTRIPRIAVLLRERLGQEPHGEVDPDLCVALGAAVQAGVEMGLDVQAVLVDITSYTFGTSVLGELYGQPYAHQFVPMIRRNTKLPTTKTDVFYTMTDDQESVEIDVYQGEDLDALKNVRIGTFMLKGLNQKSGAREQGLLFTYHLNLDGILEVHAVERATGREIRGVVENALGRSSEADMATSRERVASLWSNEEAEVVQTAPVPENVRDVLARATAMLETAPEEDREEIVDLIEDLREAVKEGQKEKIEELVQKLDEILFYLEA